MTRIKLLFSLTLVFCLCGCATPGLKCIDLANMKESDPTQEGQIGIAQFKDIRQKTAAGYVGLRILTDKSQETYLVRGQNLGTTLTLERTELTFTQKKLEQFIDQTFEEIVEKALPFK